MVNIKGFICGIGYLLSVCLDTNHSVTVDLGKKLHTARFSEIRDRTVFCAARTDGKMVYWPDGLSITVDEILELAAK